MWADNETTRDLLGFRVHADLIRSLVTNPDMLPITVGVFGDWGSGKTSVMHMIREDLKPEKYPTNSPQRKTYENIACLYFNGWLFEGYDDAKSALLSSILTQLKDDTRFTAKITEAATNLLKSVNWMRLVRFGFKEVAVPALLAYATGGLSLIPAAIDSAKKALSQNTASGSDKSVLDEIIRKPDADEPTDVRTFRDRFSKMLDDAGITSLVVLIDDLDRCSPQRIIDNLEAIKLFLSVERTAFVIGADRRIVRHAIATVYRSSEIQRESEREEQSTDIVDDYLEKLIQVPYRLPRLSPAEVETYMSFLFCERHVDDTVFAALLKAVDDHRQKDRYRVYGYGAIQKQLAAAFTDTLSQNLHFCTASAPLITEVLKGNPRQVKRFLNAYMLRKQLAGVAQLTHIRDDALVKLMVLEYADVDRFNELYDWQASQDGKPQQLQDLEASVAEDDPTAFSTTVQKLKINWDKPSLRRWVAMEPLLREEDLRDYFWIARDRLQSTLSKVSLVPPFIRQLFENLISDNSGKQHETVISMKTMEAEDVALILGLLTGHMKHHPEQKVGFDSLRLLVEQDVSGSLPVLIEVLENSHLASIEPGIGMDLLTTLKARPDLEQNLRPVLMKIAQTETKIGYVLKSQLK